MATRDEKKKLIGEYLKAADRFIQASEFTDAMTEVKKALALEPGNMYALAYNQRIKSALESLRKKEDAARVKKISESAKSGPAGHKEDPAPAPGTPEASAPAEQPEAPAALSDDDRYTIKQQLAQIERFKEEIDSLRLKHQQEISMLAEELRESRSGEAASKEKYKALVDDAEESHRRVEELYTEVRQQQAQIEQFKKEIESLRAKHEEEIAQRAGELRQAQAGEAASKEKYQALVDDAEESHRRVEELYAEVKRLHDEREQAMAAPAFDALTRESLLRAVVSHLLLAETLSAEANDVMELIRAKLGFGDDAFVQLQTAVKFDLYKSALENAWTEGFITPEKAEHLSDLRKKIGVSAEDHFRLEDELRSAKKKR